MSVPAISRSGFRIACCALLMKAALFFMMADSTGRLPRRPAVADHGNVHLDGRLEADRLHDAHAGRADGAGPLQRFPGVQLPLGAGQEDPLQVLPARLEEQVVDAQFVGHRPDVPGPRPARGSGCPRSAPAPACGSAASGATACRSSPCLRCRRRARRRRAWPCPAAAASPPARLSSSRNFCLYFFLSSASRSRLPANFWQWLHSPSSLKLTPGNVAGRMQVVQILCLAWLWRVRSWIHRTCFAIE